MEEQPNIVPAKRPRQTGFTLVELIFVVTIVAVLVVVGLPMMNEMIANQRVRGMANELFLDLTYARSEALKRNAAVQVIRTGATWTEGWTVQIGATVLRAQSQTKGVSDSGVAVSTITFSPDGRTTLGGTLNFTLSSGGSLVSARCVTVNASGRPAVRIDRNRNGDCADG